jgi:uncharacterized membrane protein YedE/YeeE
MNRRTFVAAGVAIPFLACSIIPDLIISPVSGQWGTNLLWGLIFGFGWWVAQSALGIEHWRAAAGIGLFVWPAIVLAGMYLITRLVWRLGEDRGRRVFLWLLGVSCLAIVPADTAMSIFSNAAVPPDFNYLLASW